MSYIGQRIKRLEDHDLVTGRGCFVDDIKLDGVLYAAILRSPFPHATIKSIDTSRAAAHTGVVAILTSKELPELAKYVPNTATVLNKQGQDTGAPQHPVLAIGNVCYVGQAVALVIAADRYIARDAADAIDVDYQTQDPVIDPYSALEDTSPVIHEDLGYNAPMRLLYEDGDVEKAFSESYHTVSQRYNVQRLAPCPMETRGVLAQHDAKTNVLTVWNSSQTPHTLRDQLSTVLERHNDTIRVISPDVGGGFGEKECMFPEDILIPLAALQLGAPVKWVADRQENMLTFHARGHSVDLTAAVAEDGTIQCIQARIVADLGAYFLPPTADIPDLAAHRVVGPYLIPVIRIEVIGVVTNKTPTGAYRGAGGPEAAFCTERTVDLIALDLGLPVEEIRRRNFIPPNAFPYSTPTGLTYDSGNYNEAFERALRLADYYSWIKKQTQQKGEDRSLIGIGMATVIKAGGGGGPMLTDYCRLVIDPSGKAIIYTGVSPHGQGSETSFSQIASEELGLDISNIEIIHGDTKLVPNGRGTAGSRNIAVGGSALYIVVKKAVKKLCNIAAHLLKCPISDVGLANGTAYQLSSPTNFIAFSDLASASYEKENLPPALDALLDFSGSFTLPNTPFSFGAHVVVVNVSQDTGDVSVLKYAAVHDCGRIINPTIVDGQMHGGIVQGIGQALSEHVAYTEDGQPLNGSLFDYALPIAQQIPDISLDTIETPSPTNPLGARGIGELPTVASPVAVTNAVLNALAKFGIRNVDPPLTPNRVWDALQGMR